MLLGSIPRVLHRTHRIPPHSQQRLRPKAGSTLDSREDLPVSLARALENRPASLSTHHV